MRIFLAIAAAALAASAQKFEVASIKPNKSGDHKVGIGLRPGGRFEASNVTVKQLVTMAYGIREYQVTGLPSWAESDHYDISAKPEGQAQTFEPGKMPSEAEMKTAQERMRAMVQDLLADRFGLKVHTETKDLPVYALVIAKGGPKLKEASDTAPPIIDGPPGADKKVGAMRGQMIRMGRGQLTGQSMAVNMLINQLSTVLGRNVIDRTGLTGRYDVDLKWAPEEGQGGLFRGPDGPAPEASSGESGPSLFTAIQEQLGLKLESQKGPVEIVAVDHIEKPEEN